MGLSALFLHQERGVTGSKIGCRRIRTTAWAAKRFAAYTIAYCPRAWRCPPRSRFLTHRHHHGRHLLYGSWTPGEQGV